MKGKVQYTEISDWLGINSELLAEGEQFSSNNIAVGVLVRISDNVSDKMLKWFQTFTNSADKKNQGKCGGRSATTLHDRAGHLDPSRLQGERQEVIRPATLLAAPL